jgi:hypothetical protein
VIADFCHFVYIVVSGYLGIKTSQGLSHIPATPPQNPKNPELIAIFCHI